MCDQSTLTAQLATDAPQLFASRYRAVLPTEAELQAELRRDRVLIEAAQADARSE